MTGGGCTQGGVVTGGPGRVCTCPGVPGLQAPGPCSSMPGPLNPLIHARTRRIRSSDTRILEIWTLGFRSGSHTKPNLR